MSDNRLTVIDGGLAATEPKPKRARKARVLTPWECRKCEEDLGFRTNSLIKVRNSPSIDGFKITGGRDVWVCAMCLARGRFTATTTP